MSVSLRNRIQTAWRILRGWQNPSVFWIGAQGAISEDSLTSIVFACIRLRATLLCSLPLRLYRVNADGTREIVTSGQLYDLLHKVNPYWTLYDLLWATEFSLCLYGEAFWVVEYNNNRPSELWLVNPDQIRPIADEKNYIAGFEYLPDPGRVLSTDRVVWFRYHNPFDEYDGLSPYAVAQKVVKLLGYALESNTRLFEQGVQLSGLVVPRDVSLSPEQARMLEEKITERFSGLDKAHRWGVLTFAADFQSVGISPRDAEFLGVLRWATEEICRIYGVPIDLVSGVRSYQNYEVAVRIVWQHTIKPECRLIENTLKERVLPLFSSEVHEVEFDFADVEELQESAANRWTRAKEQLEAGVLTINEWRAQNGLPPLRWGDSWWIPNNLVAIPNAPPDGEDRALGAKPRFRAIAYGSPEHRRIDAEFRQAVETHGTTLTYAILRFWDNLQRESISKLRDNPQLASEDPFDLLSAINRLREEIMPPLSAAVLAIAQAEAARLNVSFDVMRKKALEFISERAQRFAEKVSDTTWRQLRESLREGMALGESIPKLEERVLAVMADRIRSTPEVIARTEVVGALNGGKLLSWLENPDIVGKEWVATLDDRVRDTHADAHGQRTDVLGNFTVGAGSGPAPGQIGLPEEDINCRCTMIPVFRWEAGDVLS